MDEQLEDGWHGIGQIKHRPVKAFSIFPFFLPPLHSLLLATACRRVTNVHIRTSKQVSRRVREYVSEPFVTSGERGRACKKRADVSSLLLGKAFFLFEINKKAGRGRQCALHVSDTKVDRKIERAHKCESECEGDSRLGGNGLMTK